MTKVEFPGVRWEVMDALASLADAGYQQRYWLDPKPDESGRVHGSNFAIHTLFDDTDVLPEPTDCLWTVLLPGDEIVALRSLGVELDRLIDRIGGEPDEVWLEDEAWPEIVRLAGLALAAMVRSGGLF